MVGRTISHYMILGKLGEGGWALIAGRGPEAHTHIDPEVPTDLARDRISDWPTSAAFSFDPLQHPAHPDSADTGVAGDVVPSGACTIK